MVQVIAKAAGGPGATVKALLLMRAADRRMSEKDIAQAREDFERLETRTAKSVLEFHRKRRNMHGIARPAVGAGAAAELGGCGGIDLRAQRRGGRPGPPGGRMRMEWRAIRKFSSFRQLKLLRYLNNRPHLGRSYNSY